MDRVNIPGEAPGSATYYMGFAPEEYGIREVLSPVHLSSHTTENLSQTLHVGRSGKTGSRLF